MSTLTTFIQHSLKVLAKATRQKKKKHINKKKKKEDDDYLYICSESCSVVSDSLQPHELYSPWNSLGQNTGLGSLSLLQGDLPNPGIKPESPTLQAVSITAEPQRKPLFIFLCYYINKTL